MIKIMISQPMNAKTEEEITEERNQIFNQLRLKSEEDLILMDTTVPDYENKTSLHCFSESISFMDVADLVVMARGWSTARGCRLELEIATKYGKPVIFERNFTGQKIHTLTKEGNHLYLDGEML